MESIKGYKTVVFFVLAFAIALANLLGFADFQLSEEQAEVIALVIPVVGIVLRYFTNSEIFKSK